MSYSMNHRKEMEPRLRYGTDCHGSTAPISRERGNREGGPVGDERRGTRRGNWVTERAKQVGMMLPIPPMVVPVYIHRRFGWVLERCQRIRNENPGCKRSYRKDGESRQHPRADVKNTLGNE